MASPLSLTLCALLLLVCSLPSCPVRAAVAADEVTSLPGWSGPLPSRHFSGYFPTTVDGTSAGLLHYWLTLSEGDPATDPLVLWLQGGPGCSSLFGLLYENGQVHFRADNATGLPQLVLNPYAWTKAASMLWLEQPIGVGFSYCVPGAKGDCSGRNFGVDAYHFFVNFFRGYPELAKVPFHITGESYAGVYVPYVADAILSGNQQGGNPRINLVSLAIGNGVGGPADEAEEERRALDFWYGHAGISYATMKAFWAQCGASGNLSRACASALDQAEENLGSFYIYNIYDTCPHDLEAVSVAGLTEEQLARLGAPLFAPIRSARSPLKDIGFVCVLESTSSDYLNAKEVQAALHTSVANVSTWGPCSNTDKGGRHALNDHRAFLHSQGLMAPSQTLAALYQKLILELPILIYSGDVDQCVPYYYSDNWLRLLGYNVTSDWMPWVFGSSDNQQVGGYTTHFSTNNLTFVTVRDSGHMVSLTHTHTNTQA